MNNINKYLNNDYFKIGRADNMSVVRNVNISLLAILLVIGLNLIFFFIIYTTTYYSKLGEFEDVIKVIIFLYRNIEQKDNFTSTTCILD